MWHIIHILAGLLGLSVLLGSWALYEMGIISPRVDGIVGVIVWTLAYLDDTHHNEPIGYRIFELIMIAGNALVIGMNKPKKPRRKSKLRALGAKGKAALAKLKASMPKVTIPRLAPSPA